MYTIRRITLSVLLALFLLPVPSYAKTAEESMLEQGKQHFQSKKYYFAATWLGRLLQEYPSTSHRQEVLLMVAKAHVLSGRDDKAKPYLRDLLKEFPVAAATLEPGLLKLAKSAEPPPPPPPRVENQPAPAPTAGEKPVTPAVAPSTSTSTSAPTPQVPEPVPPIAKPAPVPDATAQQSPPEPAEKTAVNLPAAKPERPIPAPATATQQSLPELAEKAPVAVPAAKPVSKPERSLPAPQHQEQTPPVAKPSATTPSPVDGRGKVLYTLAAGETVNQKKLDSLLKKLEGAGFLPAVQVETKQSEVYRLVSGCYGDRKTAEKRQAEISRRGAEAFVTRSGDSFCIVAGSLMSESLAQIEQKWLARKGVRVKIVTTQIPLTVSRVSTGRFTDLREAEEAAKTLAALGVGAKVVKQTGE